MNQLAGACWSGGNGCQKEVFFTQKEVSVADVVSDTEVVSRMRIRHVWVKHVMFGIG
jgi:hypothetical protein